jgi:ATP-dependent DNA helicase RecQ
VPSRTHPQLIESVATEVARIGRLTLLGPLEMRHGGPTGGPGGNSAYRLAGVWERIAVPESVQVALGRDPGPVLLVDDLVSSRWTMTIAGRALRQAGAEGVLSFALAIDG